MRPAWGPYGCEPGPRAHQDCLLRVRGDIGEVVVAHELQLRGGTVHREHQEQECEGRPQPGRKGAHPSRIQDHRPSAANAGRAMLRWNRRLAW